MKLKRRYLIRYPFFLAIFALICLTLFWIVNWAVFQFYPPKIPDYGVTFSASYTKWLGLNPEKTYQDILSDLKVKMVRIAVPWDSVEAKENAFNFQTYDKLLDLSRENNVQVTLAIGYKVPRWPECATPIWAHNLPQNELEEKVLKLLANNINHFKNRPEISAWQIENEPLLDFGSCQMFGKDFLKKEVDLVKSLDTRPIILTDSGELGMWVTALQFSDIMGSSLYRTVWNPIFGYFNYPFPPLYYYFKAQITKTIFAPNSQEIFISELQAEPWSPKKPLDTITPEDQSKLFTLQNFREVIDFTKATRIQKQYLWGVEWWYWMKTKGHPEYWEYAKSFFN